MPLPSDWKAKTKAVLVEPKTPSQKGVFIEMFLTSEFSAVEARFPSAGLYQTNHLNFPTEEFLQLHLKDRTTRIKRDKYLFYVLYFIDVFNGGEVKTLLSHNTPWPKKFVLNAKD